jgi:hypothetical protein
VWDNFNFPRQRHDDRADRGPGLLDERADRAVGDLPEGLVYADSSFGASLAQRLAQTRPFGYWRGRDCWL